MTVPGNGHKVGQDPPLRKCIPKGPFITIAFRTTPIHSDGATFLGGGIIRGCGGDELLTLYALNDNPLKKLGVRPRSAPV